MSKVKMNENQFLGKQELNRLEKFITTDGYKRTFKSAVGSYGVVQTVDDVTFNSMKVVPGTSPGFITIQRGFAIDKDINIIDVPEDQIDILEVPDDGVNRYVVVKYATSNKEKGTINLLVDGTITGTGTEFLKILRGAPHHPVKIKFLNSTNNLQEYIVASVDDDTSAVIQGASFTPESDLEFKVVGTFIPGVLVPTPNKDIYDYDYFEARLEDISYIPLEDEEFVLAVVIFNSPNLEIRDVRPADQFQLINNNNESEITLTHNFLGLEYVKYDSEYSSKEFNLIRFGWGLRSSNGAWSADLPNNKLIVTTASGGRYASVTSVANGSLEGWRVYFSNGKYAIITENELVSGLLEVTVEDYNETVFPTNGDISIVPNADFIRLYYYYTEPGVDDIKPNYRSSHVFPIRDGFGEFRAKAGSASAIIYSRLQLNGRFSGLLGVGTGTFLNPTSFNDLGVQIATNTSSVALGGTFNNPIHPDNHHQKKAWLDQNNTFSAQNTYNGTEISTLLSRFTGQIELVPELTTGFSTPPGGVFSGFETKHHVILETAGAIINAFSFGSNGKLAIIRNATSSTSYIELTHNTGAFTQGRLFIPGGYTLRLYPGEVAGFVYNSTIEKWEHIFGKNPEAEGWRTIGASLQPAFENSYTSPGGTEAVMFRRESNGLIRLKGVLDATAAASVTAPTAFTLPAGYRPISTVTGILVKPSLTLPANDTRFAYISNAGEFKVRIDSTPDSLDFFNLSNFPPFYAEL